MSDEMVVSQWSENAYYQYFCGWLEFMPKQPCDASELVHFRNRIGEKGMELILVYVVKQKCTAAVLIKLGVVVWIINKEDFLSNDKKAWNLLNKPMHESLDNLTPRDVYIGQVVNIEKKRELIKLNYLFHKDLYANRALPDS